MKQDYWNVSDEQVIEKTGKKISEWIKILDKFKAAEKKSNDVVAHLRQEHNVPRYWARTLTTHYLKQKEQFNLLLNAILPPAHDRDTGLSIY